MSKLLRHLNSFAFVRDAIMNDAETYLVIPMRGYTLHVHANGTVFLSIDSHPSAMVEIHRDPTWNNVFWFMGRAQSGSDDWFPEYDDGDDEDSATPDEQP